mmetsp:Transcript_2775/g.2933  ORF Transcript_2775/g.2933 Transcript_2775/m.2933 type:complete len:153 (+) Transcript_2775:74-532(+)|eukprot:CAMPEP_0182421676 /NCGR_PEP_ID=MMETSP1167-20130531/7123_1 /TAXON_ID=2988 /ORGANISM="Mallomonas Sp, Strain CCMP3275" /LENGTH=152 /DNA_ID=CAMNT_0024599027 /DNA_START=66 /DNA_END=524 /DNA_ORIENTATION=-
MTQHLTAEEVSEFREIFSLLDRNGEGEITKDELSELMDTLGIDTTPEDIDSMLSEVDKDGSGTIDFEEFVAVMSKKVNATYTAANVKSAFEVFEGAAPAGFVKADVLIRSLCIYGGGKFTEEQAHDLVSQLATDSNGMINYIDYVNMMMGGV